MTGFKKIKIKVITQWRATSVSITHVSGFKIITQCRATSSSGWGQRCFVENLHIIGLKSNFFFYRGKPELAKL